MAGPTVFRELGFAVLYGREAEKYLAGTALAEAVKWGVLAFNLTLLDQSIAERFAQMLLERKLLSEEECNDAMILYQPDGNLPGRADSDCLWHSCLLRRLFTRARACSAR